MESSYKSLLAKAVFTVLKPLVRVLIRHEVSHAEFSELARQAYVDVAYEKFAIPGRKMTFSRVAVLTGLSRKEVVRLQKLLADEQPALSSKPNRAMRVINGWLSDKEFTDASGKPRELFIQGDAGSFSALVARYSGDITLGAVIDELERVGVVQRISKERVKLTTSGYIPLDDELEKIRILSVCSADLLETAVHNLDHGESENRFQRQLMYSDVPESAVQAFKAFSTERSTELLQELGQFLSQEIKKVETGPEPGKRVGLGVYYFENINQPEKGHEHEN